MLTSRIIPCLDIRAGRVVKGVRFANLRDAGDPVALAAEYQRQGADELVMLDVSATVEDRAAARETVADIRAVLSIPLCVGGGVRSIEDAEQLLESGADKIAVNTAAFDDPSLISRMADRFGRQCTIISIDAARRESAPGWEVVTRAGTNRTGADAVDWATRATKLGAGEVLLTSWDRDGARTGYDLDLLAAISTSIETPVIASGGADAPWHFLDAFRAGADAALAASIFHDDDCTVADIKAFLIDNDINVRTAP
ncbi:MAG: imidazole glycerol phosphate synthase subunit HisF [Planctomycetota bacterium]|nr:imidazole glycerol phosphate synthase subunit HisF [Planctomycetota bacterium]